jgi:uncharacterized protein YndB with AHSA1/START domain
MDNSSDRIVKKVVLDAPLERVWRAITEAARFGTWFGMEFDGEFAPGARLVGRIVPTRVDADIAKAQEPYAGTEFPFHVERIEPMRLFSFRWHPYAVEPGTDYASEPMTLVEFELEEAAAGTHLTITESGFERVPLARRAEAFASNEQGWQEQSKLIAKYLALPQHGTP